MHFPSSATNSGIAQQAPRPSGFTTTITSLLRPAAASKPPVSGFRLRPRGPQLSSFSKIFLPLLLLFRHHHHHHRRRTHLIQSINHNTRRQLISPSYCSGLFITYQMTAGSLLLRALTVLQGLSLFMSSPTCGISYSITNNPASIAIYRSWTVAFKSCTRRPVWVRQATH